MAITKIHKIKFTLSKAIKYITNEAKTDFGELVTGYNCEPEYAAKEFQCVSELNNPKSYYGRKYFMDGKDIKAYHLIQSFSPEDDITPQKAHEIGVQFAREFTGGEYQFVVATHIDRNHIHNHIIFNSTNFNSFRKFHLGQKEMHQRELISDKLCRLNGLSVISKKSGVRSRKPYEYMQHKEGRSWKDKLCDAIDRTILKSDDYDEFITRMEMEEGYEIKIGKYISFRAEGQERFTRSKRLGEKYSEASIMYRIDHKNEISKDNYDEVREKQILTVPEKIYLITPLEKRIDYLKSQKKLSQNLENKIIIDEINALVSSFNYLKKHELLYDTDIKDEYDSLTKQVKDFYKASDKISDELSELTTELRYLTNYLLSKETALKFKAGVVDQNKDVYKSKVAYDSAVKYFQSKKVNPNKLDIEKIKVRIEELKSQYKEEIEKKEELKAEQKKLYIVSQNLGKALGIHPIESFKNESFLKGQSKEATSKSDTKINVNAAERSNDSK